MTQILDQQLLGRQLKAVLEPASGTASLADSSAEALCVVALHLSANVEAALAARDTHLHELAVKLDKALQQLSASQSRIAALERTKARP